MVVKRERVLEDTIYIYVVDLHHRVRSCPLELGGLAESRQRWSRLEETSEDKLLALLYKEVHHKLYATFAHLPIQFPGLLV